MWARASAEAEPWEDQKGLLRKVKCLPLGLEGEKDSQGVLQASERGRTQAVKLRALAGDNDYSVDWRIACLRWTTGRRGWQASF